jgi:hypothetical protein
VWLCPVIAVTFPLPWPFSECQKSDTVRTHRSVWRYICKKIRFLELPNTSHPRTWNTHTYIMLSVVIHACNPSTLEAQARGLWVSGQPGLHNETWLKNKQANMNGSLGCAEDFAHGWFTNLKWHAIFQRPEGISAVMTCESFLVHLLRTAVGPGLWQ